MTALRTLDDVRSYVLGPDSGFDSFSFWRDQSGYHFEGDFRVNPLFCLNPDEEESELALLTVSHYVNDVLQGEMYVVAVCDDEDAGAYEVECDGIPTAEDIINAIGFELYPTFEDMILEEYTVG